MRQLMLAVFGTLVVASSLPAQDLRVLSAGSLSAGLEEIGRMYADQTGREVTVEVGTTPVMRERLAGENDFDVIIATRELVEEAAAAGSVDLSAAPVVARVGIGIVVRDSVSLRDLQSTEELERALLDADTVVYNRGSSGLYVAQMIEDLGLTARIGDKVTVYPNGGGVIDHVFEGTGSDLGLVPVTVIRNSEPRGLRLVALPDAVQNYTSYTAVAAAGAGDAAEAYVRFLATPRARDAFAATGVD